MGPKIIHGGPSISRRLRPEMQKLRTVVGGAVMMHPIHPAGSGSATNVARVDSGRVGFRAATWAVRASGGLRPRPAAHTPPNPRPEATCASYSYHRGVRASGPRPPSQPAASPAEKPGHRTLPAASRLISAPVRAI